MGNPGAQGGWRWCHKCQGLYSTNNTGSRCPKGGAHDDAGSGHYWLIRDAPAYRAQPSWRCCHKCQGLYLAGQSLSHCPAGGAHDDAGSGDYSLVNQNPEAPGQHGWRWCQRCQGLFFAQNPGSVCPAGGAHDPAGSGDYALPKLARFEVAPHDTDPGIRVRDLQGRTPHHIAYRPADDPGNGRLLVFLPGSGGIPESSSSELFVQLAAIGGYHAIGLVYVNDHAIGPAKGGGTEGGDPVLCTKDKGLDCFADKREQNLEGKIGSTYVDPPNSIHNRLVKLLAWLHRTDDGAGWGTFFDGTTPKWELSTWAGHSQGGGMAAFVAMKHKIHRAAMMSSPSDGFDTQIAPWVNQNPATDPDRFFGFANVNDPRYQRILEIWSALGLPGPGVHVDPNDAMAGAPHKVLTNVSSDPHNSVTEPSFLEIWRYLMGS